MNLEELATLITDNGRLPLSYRTGATREKMDIKRLIKEYKDQKCKEQRELCADEYAYDSPTNDSNNYEINGEGLKNVVMYEITNAPEPDD